MADSERYTLYRFDWEEGGVKNFSYAPVPKDEPAPVVEGFTVRPASDIESEAYTEGFEDGYSMCVASSRLYEMEAEELSSDDIPLWDEEFESESESGVCCGGSCSCGAK